MIKKKAIEYLNKNNQKWSDKRIDIDKWNEQEILLFETAMKNTYKQFNYIHQHLVKKGFNRKSLKKIIHFYYVWKELPRYEDWRKQFIQKQTTQRKSVNSRKTNHPSITSIRNRIDSKRKRDDFDFSDEKINFDITIDARMDPEKIKEIKRRKI